MINRTVLIGCLTKEPDLRYTNSGTAVASFTLAVNRQFTNSKGEHEADFRVELWKNGSHKTFLVSRLVASAFVTNPFGKPCINHLDGNPLNNKPSNLEWCTYKENQIHTFKTDLNKSPKQIFLISSFSHKRRGFYSMAEASRWLHMSSGYISGLLSRGITRTGEYIIQVGR